MSKTIAFLRMAITSKAKISREKKEEREIKRKRDRVNNEKY
jgi:hypothetical protein